MSHSRLIIETLTACTKRLEKERSLYNQHLKEGISPDKLKVQQVLTQELEKSINQLRYNLCGTEY